MDFLLAVPSVEGGGGDTLDATVAADSKGEAQEKIDNLCPGGYVAGRVLSKAEREALEEGQCV